MFDFFDTPQRRRHRVFCAVARLVGAIPLLVFIITAFASKYPRDLRPYFGFWFTGELAMISDIYSVYEPLVPVIWILMFLLLFVMVMGLLLWNTAPGAAIAATTVYGLDTLFLVLCIIEPGFGVYEPEFLHVLVHAVILTVLLIGVDNCHKLNTLRELEMLRVLEARRPKPDASWLDNAPEKPEEPAQTPEQENRPQSEQEAPLQPEQEPVSAGEEN